MASLIYDSVTRDEATAAVDFDTDTFYAMLVTSSYVPNKGTHAKRSDVTNEVSGTGYSAGGAASAVTVALDTSNHKTTITFGAVSWASSSITARGAVYYKHRGGASSADELVAYDDFGADVTSTNGTFSLGATTITKQN
jgi:hypothetical protein